MGGISLKGSKITSTLQNVIDNGSTYSGSASVELGTNVSTKGNSKLMKVSDDLFETAQTGVEYYSPSQHGGIYGTVYRKYFDVPNIAAGGFVTIALGLTPNHVPNVGGYVILNTSGNKVLIGTGSGNTASDIGIYVHVDGSDLILNANAGINWDSGYCWVDYTK